MSTYFCFRRRKEAASSMFSYEEIKQLVLDVIEKRTDEFGVTYSNVLFLQDAYVVTTAEAPSEEALRASHEKKGMALGPSDVHLVRRSLKDVEPIRNLPPTSAR